MLAGSGTAGAYQAGVLRALHEAGIKIDLVAGRGAGVIGAMFAAMDGGARLWDDNGVWRRPAALKFYRWRRPLRIAGWALAGCGRRSWRLPIGLLLVAMAIALAGMLLTFIGLESAGHCGQRRLQPLDRDALRPGRGANLRSAARGAGGARRGGRGCRRHRRSPPFRTAPSAVPATGSPAGSSAVRCRRRRSSRAAARSSGT